MAMAPKSHAHNHSQADLNAADLLRVAKLKVTQPRLAILDVMISEHGPFTTDELHAKLSSPRSNSPCDVVTIYRCLAKFENLGLINRCDFGDGSVRYELRNKDHHHHIICRQCKRVEPLAKCPVEDRVIQMPNLGFKDVSHRLEFFGVCPECVGSAH